MKDLENNKLVEIKESELEKEAFKITNGDVLNFDDCALTEKEALLKLREKIVDFNDCFKQPDSVEQEEDFQDCKKR